MGKPWFIDFLTYALVAVWMGWTFASIQTHGPGPWLIGSAVIVLAVGLFMIYGQRLSYLQIGSRVFVAMQGDEEPDADEWRKRNR